MASSNVSAQEDQVESRDVATDSPLLDSAIAAVKKLIARGRERGYVRYDALNASTPESSMPGVSVPTAVLWCGA